MMYVIMSIRMIFRRRCESCDNMLELVWQKERQIAYFDIVGALIELANHGKHGGLEVVDLRLLLKAPPREIGQDLGGHEFIQVVFEMVVVTRLQLCETQRRRPLLAANALTSVDILNVLELSEEFQRRWLEFVKHPTQGMAVPAGEIYFNRSSVVPAVHLVSHAVFDVLLGMHSRVRRWQEVHDKVREL